MERLLHVDRTQLWREMFFITRSFVDKKKQIQSKQLISITRSKENMQKTLCLLKNLFL